MEKNIGKKSVYQIVGDSICVEADDGKKVNDILVEFLSNNQPVELSFLNIKMITSAFLNTAIGLLYKNFTEDVVKKYLKIVDMNPADLQLLKRVVMTAKEFYKNPDKIRESVEEILGE